RHRVTAAAVTRFFFALLWANAHPRPWVGFGRTSQLPTRPPEAPYNPYTPPHPRRPVVRDVPHRRLQPDARHGADADAHRRRPAPARTRFLDWLAHHTAGRDDVVRVVFDAQAAPAASPEIDYRGVRVAFAFGRTADELIEELVAAEPRPDRVTVVSNDGQVRE